MKNGNYLKSIALSLAIAILLPVLSSCGKAPSNIQTGAPGAGQNNNEGSFTIKYELGDEFTDVFTDMPQEARAGDTVELRTEILFDADIHVYVDGQEISKTHYDSDYWGYSFVMPEKDVTVTARFYTKYEIWGTDAVAESALRENYPEYFGLSTFKGLEVFVWQMAPNSYSCGIMEGTNREKTLEEMMNLKGASIDEMRAILSSYDIPKEDIIIIPWQNPISSYLGEYWISQKDEDPDSVARRRQEYIDRLREMLLGDDTTATKVAYANWTENSEIISSCLNAEKAEKRDISTVWHLPVYKFDTREDLNLFREKFKNSLTFDQGYNEVPSFNEVVSDYDDSFFAEHSLILAYVAAGSGSLRFGVRDVYCDDSTFCLNVVQTNHPEVGTSDMAGWFVIAEVLDKELENITDYDAKVVTETFELPDDFAFSIVWGTYGISSYDSKTGKLVKTKDATDVSKYTSTVQLTEEQLKEVYHILLSDIDLFKYPDSYDPFNAPDAEIRVASEPNQTIIISVTANGLTKTVTCSGVAFGSSGYCEEARVFMSAENEIVELITSLPEWVAFPEYEFFYE